MAKTTRTGWLGQWESNITKTTLPIFINRGQQKHTQYLVLNVSLLEKKKGKKKEGEGGREWKWVNKGVDSAVWNHPTTYPSVELG